MPAIALSTLLIVGCCDLHENFRAYRPPFTSAALLALVAVVTGTFAALTCGSQRPPVQDDCAGLALLTVGDTQDPKRIVDHVFSDCPEPRQAAPATVASAALLVEVAYRFNCRFRLRHLLPPFANAWPANGSCCPIKLC